jgi:hypothetical protein
MPLAAPITAEEVEVAEALAAQLNTLSAAGAFSQSFDARVISVPKMDLKELADVKVSLIAGDSDETDAGRGFIWVNTSVLVGIMKKVSARETNDGLEVDESEIPGLLGFFQELRNAVRQGIPALQAAWMGTERGALFGDVALKNQAVFSKACLVKHRMRRPR